MPGPRKDAEPTTVKNLLKNERYSGRAIFQGITLDFAPIIPRDQ